MLQGVHQSLEPGGGRRVLVVDDEEAVRAVVARALSLWGYQPVVACSGEEAVAHLGDAKGEYACALLDLTMPGIGSAGVLDAIATRLPGLGVVLMSGFEPGYAAEQLGARTPAVFLRKPFDLATLRETVESAIPA